jgi:DNA polymerase-4
MHERTIIHLNVADFAVAVERLSDVRLQHRPVIIAPAGAPRAVVYDMSEEAYQAGIRKGMPLRRAVRRCTDALLLPPHPNRYEQAMQALLKQALPYSPLIEPGTADGHLFVDVSGTNRLFGPAVDVAWRLHRQVKKALYLDPIWSVAPNKLVAKVATRLVKPTGEYIVGAGEEQHLLAPLPLELIPGIERPDLIRLQEFNLTRVYQAAAFSLNHLEVAFGRRALWLYEALRGVDHSPVQPFDAEPPAVCAAHEFGNDTNDKARVEGAFYRLVEQVGRQLRRQRRAAGRLVVVLDYTDGLRRVRRQRLQPATANDITLFEHGRQALARAWQRRVRVRHLRLKAEKLVFPPAQRQLFAVERRQQRKRMDLIAAVDTIRRRFGGQAITIGRALAA